MYMYNQLHILRAARYDKGLPTHIVYQCVCFKIQLNIFGILPAHTVFIINTIDIRRSLTKPQVFTTAGQ